MAKTKLTDEVRNAICESIRGGNYAKVAAEAANISESTFYSWLDQGEKARSGKYLEFLESIKRAESESEENAVRVVKEAMPLDWKAAMTYLERRHPERWGRRDKQTLEHTGKGGGPIQTEDVGPSKAAQEIRQIDNHISELDVEIAALEKEAQEAGASEV